MIFHLFFWMNIAKNQLFFSSKVSGLRVACLKGFTKLKNMVVKVAKRQRCPIHHPFITWQVFYTLSSFHWWTQRFNQRQIHGTAPIPQLWIQQQTNMDGNQWWFKECHQPAMTGNGLHSTYIKKWFTYWGMVQVALFSPHFNTYQR